jgi:hypothetical protein
MFVDILLKETLLLLDKFNLSIQKNPNTHPICKIIIIGAKFENMVAAQKQFSKKLNFKEI